MFVHLSQIVVLFQKIVCTALSAKIAELDGKFDFVCGVPIGASHYASVVGWKDELKVLTYRKDVKVCQGGAVPACCISTWEVAGSSATM